ncbi:MAG: aldo/keto reductase [Nitrospinota bacterium]|nr:MAG: aldo/keto reductase [Nitrospinota bacterium]
MQYRVLGSTGLQISEIVFGAGAVGGVVFQSERETRIEAVRRALKAGINWIDTAPSYGAGRSEENLGWILKTLQATPYLSTKVHIKPEHLSDIPGEIQRSLEASLQRLQRDTVDLLQLHTPVTRERGTLRNSIAITDVLRKGGVVSGFERLREQGLVRFFGFTGLGDTDCLHELITSGHFQAVQAYYNLLNPSAGRPVPPHFSAQNYRQLIDLAAAHGVGVLNIRVLAAGALAGKAPPAGFPVLSPGSDSDADMARAEKVRQALGLEWPDMVQTAIRFALMHPGVSGVLVGFSTPEQVDEAVAASTLGPLPPTVLQRLDALYASDFQEAR